MEKNKNKTKKTGYLIGQVCENFYFLWQDLRQDRLIK